MLVAVVVRIGGRVHAGALLRTSGEVQLREALRSEAAWVGGLGRGRPGSRAAWACSWVTR
jgi:hypothetical protein